MSKVDGVTCAKTDFGISASQTQTDVKVCRTDELEVIIFNFELLLNNMRPPALLAIESSSITWLAEGGGESVTRNW